MLDKAKQTKRTNSGKKAQDGEATASTPDGTQQLTAPGVCRLGCMADVLMTGAQMHFRQSHLVLSQSAGWAWETAFLGFWVQEGVSHAHTSSCGSSCSWWQLGGLPHALCCLSQEPTGSLAH